MPRLLSRGITRFHPLESLALFSVSDHSSSASTRANRGDSRSSTSATRESTRAEVDIAPPQSKHWFPVWGPALIMLGVIITGFVLGLQANQVPHSFFVLFALAALAVTVFVEPRALFLTVASLPLYYMFGSVIIGWNVSESPGGNTGRKAKLINAVYPAIEHYLWLLIPFILVCLLAALRWHFYREELARSISKAEIQRRRLATAERTNRERYSKARERTTSRTPPHTTESRYRTRRSTETSSSTRSRLNDDATSRTSASPREAGSRWPSSSDKTAAGAAIAASAAKAPSEASTPAAAAAPSHRIPRREVEDSARNSSPSFEHRNYDSRTSEELREASRERQRRREPLPQRRQPPRHHISDLGDKYIDRANERGDRGADRTQDRIRRSEFSREAERTERSDRAERSSYRSRYLRDESER